MNENTTNQTPEQRSAIGRFLRFCLNNRLLIWLSTIAVIITGLLVAPFDWNFGGIQRYPVPVDAIPDIGENQQIVFTQWMGRSPQDVEDQISYPLTVSLLGIPGVKTVRSYSLFGFSSIFIIFKEDVDFYWSRTRVLEKLNSLPPGTLPPGVVPTLGPDATALGQIYWYTLEGLDPVGRPTGGWGLDELRTIEDWYVRYWLLSADGVSDVGSVGGYVKEYQIDVDPDAMRAYGVDIEQVYHAVMAANIDVGAKSIEVNRTEYFIRGIGFIKQLEDIENSVVKVNADNVPVLVKHVAHVTLGPATRRGALDKGGAPAVGGVVVARYGDNPLKVINNVKAKIDEMKGALPSKVILDETASRRSIESYAVAHGFTAYSGSELNQTAWLSHLRSIPRTEWPAWATISQVTIVPFYDRAGLIYETLGTLNDAIFLEILVTVIVVLVMVMHLRSGFIISSMLPLAVLLCFIGMKFFNVQANIVALSGIAIAIGAIVATGILICENILRMLKEAPPDEPLLETVHRAASEVGSAILTAVATTVVSFLPVFTMIGAEGKLFKPLAYTKTFALIASIVIAMTVLPVMAYTLFKKGKAPKAGSSVPERRGRMGKAISTLLKHWPIIVTVLLVGILLTSSWTPLGPERGFMRNFIFVAVLVGGLLGFFALFQSAYVPLLRWCLAHKKTFLAMPLLIMLFGTTAWLGFGTVFGFLPAPLRNGGEKLFPGLGKEFMPPLDEGSFLWMPTTMTHASIGEAIDIVSLQDRLIQAVPEVDSVVGKIGRADTPIDPAPVSMFEAVINYTPEYRTDKAGRRIKYKYENGDYVLDASGDLIPDPHGRPYRQWRDYILTPDDIWSEIVKVSKLPGTTSAPKLQPIAARIVMLQSGMRAPMGVKIKGPDLETIEKTGLEIEKYLKQVPSVQASAVVADRIVGKPYLEIVPDRQALARYGIPIRRFQDVLEVAIGGRKTTTTVEGRERFPVRVRYSRELRDDMESMKEILIAGKGGQQIPITEVARIRYVRGPQVIKSEDTFLVGYVVFDKKPGHAEVNVVEDCQNYLKSKVASGEFMLPKGVSYTFAGSYENQIRAAKTLSLILPLALFVILMIIYFQFKSFSTTLLVFSGIFVAWTGGFILVWLYGQPWFMNFHVFGVDMRILFQLHPINMSVAVWVGFLVLFGVASDNGVIQSTCLEQVFRDRKPDTRDAVREATVVAAERRVRPCLMTSATTILALLPVLTSNGRGSDVMVPMAIPSFGGMLIVLISIFVVPVLYCAIKERGFKKTDRRSR